MAPMRRSAGASAAECAAAAAAAQRSAAAAARGASSAAAARSAAAAKGTAGLGGAGCDGAVAKSKGWVRPRRRKRGNMNDRYAFDLELNA